MDQGVDKDSICQTCGKNELVFSGPNILGSSDNALGKKLMESIILIRHSGTSIYMFLAPLANHRGVELSNINLIYV
jgi:hypothetical protein